MSGRYGSELLGVMVVPEVAGMSCDAALLLCVADPRHCWLWIGQVESCVVFVVVAGSGLFSVSLN
jgi:hypothetical protein